MLNPLNIISYTPTDVRILMFHHSVITNYYYNINLTLTQLCADLFRFTNRHLMSMSTFR
jgi:uncharacterized membrane protein